MKSFISLEEAIEILNEKVNPLSIEEVELLEGIGCRTGETIYSPISHPPFDKSAMDGYAVRAEATKQGEVRLKLVDEVYAGHVSDSEVTSKTAIRIMTGAKIPEGANAVIKQEEVKVEDGFLVFNQPLRYSENICFKGEDIEVGQLLVPKEKLLDYADIGILACAGISQIKVYPKPRVAFITTGDEVLDLEWALEPGKIYNSNKYAVIGRIKELGYEVTYLNHEQDRIKGIADKLKEAVKVSDVVITTGGASVGEKDLIKEAIDELGGTKLFWKILIKPGSAVLVSEYEGTKIISLSGNPTAALTTFELMVRPVLEKLGGKHELEIKREKAVLKTEFTKKSPQRRFIRGYAEMVDETQVVSVTQVKSGNGILSSALNSNCLIEIEANDGPLTAGEVVKIIKL